MSWQTNENGKQILAAEAMRSNVKIFNVFSEAFLIYSRFISLILFIINFFSLSPFIQE